MTPSVRTRWRSREHGSGRPTLVFIHGAGGTSLTWLKVLRRLAGTYRCVAPDLPGHGHSVGDLPGSIEAYRESLRSFIRDRGLDESVLVGHSMGGAIALDYVLAYPGSTRALVLCCSAARFDVSAELVSMLRSNAGAGLRRLAGAAFARSVAPDEARAAAASLMLERPAVTAHDLSVCERYDASGRLDRVVAPTLVVGSDEDRLTPIRQSETLAAGIAGAKLIRVPGAGHMLPWEKPKHLAEAITGLLT